MKGLMLAVTAGGALAGGGMNINKDDAFIALGSSGDVVLERSGDGILDITASVNVDASLSVGSDVSVGGNIALTGEASIGSDASVSGDLSVAGGATIEAAISVGSDAGVGGDLSVAGGATIEAAISVGSDAGIGGDLSVAGGAAIEAAISVGSEASVGGDLSVAGGATIEAGISVGSNAIIGADMSVEGDLAIGGGISVADTTFFDQFTDTHTFMGENEEVMIQRGVAVTQTFTTSADYQISLELKPYGTTGTWTNIFHFTATNNNCCNYGSRIPAMWFYADSTRLHIIAGTNETGNAGFHPTDELPMGDWTRVTIRVMGDEGMVYYNDTYMGSVKTDERLPHDDVQVWMSDPWHKPAKTYVRNVVYQRISYHHPGFYNDFTEYDAEDSMETRVETIEEDVDDLQTSVMCTKEECCSGNYEWSGDTLKCWSLWYSSYDEDPCRCHAVVYNLGTSTAFDHQINCNKQGAHLMSIHSGTASAAIAAHGSTLWIGLHDTKDEGNFRWFDGTPASYTSWNTNEPNDSNGEDCVHTTSTNTIWNDQDCDEALSYRGICLFQ